MAKKKSNRVSLEENKRIYRRNQAIMAKAARQNDALEPVITEQENFEIVGIIRKYKIGLDNLSQVMEGIHPSGESLFSEEKLKPVSLEEEEKLIPPKKAKEKKAEAPQKTEKQPETEETEHEKD